MDKDKTGWRGLWPALLILPWLLGFSGLASAATVLDSFDTSQSLVDDTADGAGASASVGGGADPTIVGGERDAYVELLSGPTQVKLDIVSPPGYFAFSADALATGRGMVQWDGPDNSITLNPTGLGGIDLTEGGTVN